jgi:cof-like hydrolase
MKGKLLRKMIVTDLDGTLLKNDKSLSRYTIDVIEKLRGRGHKFVVATARPFRAVKKFMNSVNYDAGIYHNGSLIYMDGKEVDDFKINNVKEIIDKILSRYPESLIAAEVEDVLYSNFDADLFWPGTGFVYTDSNFFELKEKKADKVIVMVSSLEDMKKYDKLLPSELYIQLSEERIGMIMNKNATKSNGIKFLAEKYDIDIGDIISFGDDYNDVDMIKFCGTGVCVLNAVDEVKKFANQICDTNENDGVAKWIDEFIL